MKMLLYVLFALCQFYIVRAQSQCSLLISEILFNPPKNGYDYVELFNASDTSVNLNHFLLANRNAAGDVASFRRLTTTDFQVKPHQHVVITPDLKWLSQNYHLPDTVRVCEVSALPSYPDDEGTVVLLSRNDSSVCDELRYSKDWHFELIDDPAGVSLERISYQSQTQNAHSWASASSASGYGTPGYSNSQFIAMPDYHNEVILKPSAFSPDNNGVEDYATLTVTTDMPGAVASSVIYDAGGRRVRYLLKNEILGTKNIFKWNGFDDNSKQCAPGVYIMATTIFNLGGRIKKFRNVVAIAYPSQ